MNKINLVSVLTPTYNRRKFIPQYLRNIKNQDYNGPIEILIADDGTDSIEDLLPNNSSFKYIKLDSKKTIGYKRNLLCDEANGDILINMDDDDFYPPQRISHAVDELQKHDVYIAGCSLLYIYDKKKGICHNGPLNLERGYHASAGTFAFYKEYLELNKFDDDAKVSEELMFTHHFTNPLIQLDPLKTNLVISHQHNTVNKEKSMNVQTPLILKEIIHDDESLKFYLNL